MIKLFYGEDSFSIQNEIANETASESIEVVRFNDDINLLINNLLSSSFFTQKRFFLCEDYINKLTDKDLEKLIVCLEKIPADTNVIFIESKAPSKKVTDYIRKIGEIKVFNKPLENDVIGFINSKVQAEGGQISPLAAERLASFVGSDYWQLSEEIKKLVLYKKDEIEDIDIQATDIDLLIKSNFEASIFELMDAISTKNQRKSAKLLNQFLESGENGMYIFAMIAKQFRNIALAKFENPSNEATFAKKAGLHPYVAKKSIIQAKNFDKAEILIIYKKLVTADLSLKSGFEPKIVLQSLIF